MKIKITILIMFLSSSSFSQNYKKLLIKGNNNYNDSLYEAAETGRLSGSIYKGVWSDIGTPERLNDFI